MLCVNSVAALSFAPVAVPAGARVAGVRMEIKAGRVAMFAFVGFIAGENNVHFPWATTLSGTTYDQIAAAGGACAQWDAVPTAAKWQIFLLIGLLEFWSEGGGRGETTHYMKGAKPGVFPSFQPIRDDP